MIDLPDVTFQDNSGSNWRESLADEIDPDDEELDETPEDVIMMLGFDPKEFSEESAAVDPKEGDQPSGEGDGG